MTTETRYMACGVRVVVSSASTKLIVRYQVYFFFSSRRRHTRLQGDWSSDVCSSDLQVTHAGLAGVAANDGGDGRLGELDVFLGEAVIGELLGDQKLARDHHLLLGRVAGKVDHLHAVEQRPRDRVIDVRGRDKEHLGKIERDQIGRAH